MSPEDNVNAGAADASGGNDNAGVGNKGAGGTTDSWYSGESYSKLSEDDRSLLGKYKSEDEFIKGSINAMRTIGKKGAFNAEIPEKDDPKYAEKMSALYGKLGRPESPDKYEIAPVEVPEEFKESFKFDPEFAKSMQIVAHKHGISQAALAELAAGLQAKQLALFQDGMKERLAQVEANEKKLAEDPNYPVDKELVKRLLDNEKLGDLWTELETTGLGNSPSLFKMLAKYAKETLAEGEIDTAKAGASGKGGGKTKELSQYEKNKRDFPYSQHLWGDPNAK